MKPVLIDLDQLAKDCIGKDIVNSRGLFHVTSAKALHNPSRVEARCTVTSHKLCADNLVHGTQSMGERVFILTLAEAKALAKKPSVKAAFTSAASYDLYDTNGDIAF